MMLSRLVPLKRGLSMTLLNDRSRCGTLRFAPRVEANNNSNNCIANCGSLRCFGAKPNHQFINYKHEEDAKSVAKAYMAQIRRAKTWRGALKVLKRIEMDGRKPDVFHFSKVIDKCAKDHQWKQAITLLREMEKRGIKPNVVSYGAAITACGESGRYEKALELLREMECRGIKPNVINYNATISACAKRGQCEKTLELLREMEGRGIKPNVISYSAAITACGESGQYEKALELLREMEGRGIKPNVVSYGAAITACAESGQYEKALELLREMEGRGIKPDVISYSAAISACGESGRYEKALELLREMDVQGMKPNVISYSAAISAFAKGQLYSKGLELFTEMEERGMKPDGISYDVAIICSFAARQFGEALSLLNRGQVSGFFPPTDVEAQKWDLRGVGVARGCIMLTHALLLHVLGKSEGLECGRCSKNIVVITGVGNEAVLQTGIRRFLEEGLGLQTSVVPNNPGCLALQKSALSEWRTLNQETLQQVQSVLCRDQRIWTAEDRDVIDSLFKFPSTPKATNEGLIIWQEFLSTLKFW